MAETPNQVTWLLNVDVSKFVAAMNDVSRSILRTSRATRRFVKYYDMELPHRTTMHAAYDHRRRARGRRRRR